MTRVQPIPILATILLPLRTETLDSSPNGVSMERNEEATLTALKLLHTGARKAKSNPNSPWSIIMIANLGIEFELVWGVQC